MIDYKVFFLEDFFILQNFGLGNIEVLQNQIPYLKNIVDILKTDDQNEKIIRNILKTEEDIYAKVKDKVQNERLEFLFPSVTIKGIKT